MTTESGAAVLIAKRAAQHVRLSRDYDACECLCVLTLPPSLAPLRLMLADTPLPRGSGAALASVGYIVQGLRTVRCLPAPTL